MDTRDELLSLHKIHSKFMSSLVICAAMLCLGAFLTVKAQTTNGEYARRYQTKYWEKVEEDFDQIKELQITAVKTEYMVRDLQDHTRAQQSFAKDTHRQSQSKLDKIDDRIRGLKIEQLRTEVRELRQILESLEDAALEKELLDALAEADQELYDSMDGIGTVGDEPGC